VSDEPTMREFLDLGVDGIISDFPGLAVKVAASRG
jgi:glycerophosphoryl diester phosphodiesterase